MKTAQPDPPPTDHAWITDQHGVLACIAGDTHTPTTFIGCPYYLHHDVVSALPTTVRPRWRADTQPTLTYQNRRYFKITELAWPHEWRALIDALPETHALAPAAWSLLSMLTPAPGVSVLDPRQALIERIDTAPTSRSVWLIRSLLEGLGDPTNDRGMLGLTGSAALDPAKLVTGTDLDLLIYPPTSTADLAPVLNALGARFLADLPDTDPRLADYQRSRIMTPVADPATSKILRRRRRDVCWLDGLRVDLTDATGQQRQVPHLIYQRAPDALINTTLTIGHISPDYPAVVTADDVAGTQLVITARGYSTGVLLPGDRLRLRASLHKPSAAAPFLSLDDAAGHELHLLEQEQPC